MTYRCVSRTMHARGSLRAFAPTPVLSGRDRQRPALKLLQKGSHRRGEASQPSANPVSRAQDLRRPPSRPSPPTPLKILASPPHVHASSTYTRLISRLFHSGNRASRNFVIPRLYRRVRARWWPYCRQIRGNLLGFFLLENNVVPSLEWNNRSSIVYVCVYRGSRHVAFSLFRGIIAISLNCELFVRIKFLFRFVDRFHIHSAMLVTFASRNDSWKGRVESWREEESTRNACTGVSSSSVRVIVNWPRWYSFFSFCGD